MEINRNQIFNPLILLKLIFITIILPVIASDSKTMIRGFVESYEWNDEDIIVQISILVDPADPLKKTGSNDPIDYEDYVVKNTPKGRELFQFIGMYVEITGTVTLDVDSTKIISIDSYKILNKQSGN